MTIFVTSYTQTHVPGYQIVFNPFKPNGISHLSIEPVHVRFMFFFCFFYCYSNSNRTFCRPSSGDPDQIPHSVASVLGLHCLHMCQKKDAKTCFIPEKTCHYELSLMFYPAFLYTFSIFNSFLASLDFCHLLITLICKQFGARSEPT